MDVHVPQGTQDRVDASVGHKGYHSVFDREVSMNAFIVSGRPGKLQEITVGDAESWHGMAGDDG